MNLLANLANPGGAIAVNQQCHAARFQPAVVSQTWELTAIRTDESTRQRDPQSQINKVLPSLTTKLITADNELNEEGIKLKQIELQLVGMQQQLMADWRKFLYFDHTPAFPEGSTLHTWLGGGESDPIRNCLDNVLQSLIAKINDLTQAKEDRSKVIRGRQESIRRLLEATDAEIGRAHV